MMPEQLDTRPILVSIIRESCLVQQRFLDNGKTMLVKPAQEAFPLGFTDLSSFLLGQNIEKTRFAYYSSVSHGNACYAGECWFSWQIYVGDIGFSLDVPRGAKTSSRNDMLSDHDRFPTQERNRKKP